LNTLGSKEKNALLKLDTQLNSVVVGQEEAVEAVSNAIKRARTGISDENRPWASFLFLGPTGVGKSELAKALTQELFGNEDRLVQIDMSELMEGHSVSKLIGSPPGYVGYREGGRLTEEIRRNPHSVILFDEIEKAHGDVLNLLLQILEDGHLTDGKGRTVNFKNSIIILTSNIGAEEISKDKILGFVGSKKKESDGNMEDAYESMKESLLSELKNTLRPELINRLDDIVIFRALNRKDARKIVKLLVEQLNERLKDQGIKVKLGRKLVTHVVNEGFSEEYGARPLRRVIQDSIENTLAEYLLANELENEKDIKEIKLNLEDDEVVVV
jgi:ATP-dependent Clp protease ATP-binding subunit ClpC